MLNQRNAEVKQAEAALGEKQAFLQLLKTRFERIAGLVKKDVIGEEKLDEPKFAMDAAESALTSVRAAITTATAGVAAAKSNILKTLADTQSAQAEVDVAKASVSLLKTRAEYLTIKAPFPGVITKRMIDRGAFVQPADSNSGATPLFEITRIDKVRVCAAVPSSKAAGIHLKQKTLFLSIGGLPGVSLEGQLSRSANSLSSETRMMPIEVHFNNPITQANSGKTITLQPGMFGTVRVTVNSWDKDHLLPVVPASAVVADENNQSYVMVVENGTCKKTRVDILVFKDAENIGIKSGINLGAVVMHKGVKDLKEGQKSRNRHNLPIFPNPRILIADSIDKVSLIGASGKTEKTPGKHSPLVVAVSYPLDQGRSMAMIPRWFRQFALILSALVVCLGGCRFRGNLQTAAIEHRNVNRTIPPRLISKPAQVAKRLPKEKRLPEETSKTSDVSVASQTQLIPKPAQAAKLLPKEKRLPEETPKTSDVSVASQQLNKEEHSDETSQTISEPFLLLRSHESSSDSDDLPLVEVAASDSAQVITLKTAPELLVSESDSEHYLVDLPTALRLAGADNWNVLLAAETGVDGCGTL